MESVRKVSPDISRFVNLRSAQTQNPKAQRMNGGRVQPSERNRSLVTREEQ